MNSDMKFEITLPIRILNSWKYTSIAHLIFGVGIPSAAFFYIDDWIFITVSFAFASIPFIYVLVFCLALISSKQTTVKFDSERVQIQGENQWHKLLCLIESPKFSEGMSSFQFPFGPTNASLERSEISTWSVATVGTSSCFLICTRDGQRVFVGCGSVLSFDFVDFERRFANWWFRGNIPDPKEKLSPVRMDWSHPPVRFEICESVDSILCKDVWSKQRRVKFALNVCIGLSIFVSIILWLASHGIMVSVRRSTSCPA